MGACEASSAPTMGSALMLAFCLVFKEIWSGRHDFADSELKATSTLGAPVRLVIVREGSILEFYLIVRSSV